MLKGFWTLPVAQHGGTLRFWDRHWRRPLAEREQQIDELEREIDRLQRTEEAIVVATGAPRERGPPWVVLGVKAAEAPGVRAA
jgi:hypothetical protein